MFSSNVSKNSKIKTKKNEEGKLVNCIALMSNVYLKA